MVVTTSKDRTVMARRNYRVGPMCDHCDHGFDHDERRAIILIIMVLAWFSTNTYSRHLSCIFLCVFNLVYQ